MKKTTMFKLLTVVFFLLNWTLAQAQNSGTGVISGSVMDADLSEALPYVTVKVKVKGSGELFGGQITDKKGRFSVDTIPMGTYVLEFQFIGFETLKKEVTLADKEKVNLGVLYLKEDVTALEGVEVIAERSTIEQKVDRKVINIGKDLATTGTNAADLMANIPSVNVDQNGAISLRGNENVRILVDGKPTNLSADQLLQQIPAASIKSIELITNPSAKFIPDGMSGIINIVLRKNSNLGLNGNISTVATFGEEYRFTGSADVNYKTKKVNLFANYGNTHGLKPLWGDIVRPGDPSRETWAFMDDAVSHLFKIGLDYALTERTTLSAYTIQNKFNNQASRFTAIRFPQAETNNFSQQYLSGVENHTSTYNFDLKHQFTEEGALLELEFDYSEFNEEDLAAFSFEGANVVASNAQEVIDMARQNTTINLDYTNPIGKTKN